MRLTECELEIRERYYLIDAVLEHISGTHKIKIHELVTYKIDETEIYCIKCNYSKGTTKNEFEGVILSEKLIDILSQYIPY